MVTVSLLTVVKYGFLALITTGAGVLIASIAVTKHFTTTDDLVYNPSPPLHFESSQTFLDQEYTKCLTEPSKSFCLLAANKRLELFRNKRDPTMEDIKDLLNDTTPTRRGRRHPVHRLLEDFMSIMIRLGVRPVLVEPSMLFCMLSPSKKLQAITSGFHPKTLAGSSNVITFGAFKKDAEILDTSNAVSALLSDGFQISRSRRWNRAWTQVSSRDAFETTHYFLSRRHMMVHVVVFHPRANYLRHSGIDTDDTGIRTLLFQKDEGYENFTATPLTMQRKALASLSIPSDPLQFLAQIGSSQFLECPGTYSDSKDTDRENPSLTAEQMRTRTQVAIKELKAYLSLYMVPFWIWSETLLGWYRQCDIFHYSPDLVLAMTSRSAKVSNLSELLTDNEYLKVEEKFGKGEDLGYKLDCHGLMVYIYFLFEEGDNLSYVDPSAEENPSRFIYRKFELCSADVFGEKIHVPCDAKEVFRTEYGDEWTKVGWTRGQSALSKKNRRPLKEGAVADGLSQ